MIELPKRISTSATGDLAVVICEKMIRKIGWLFREISKNDYGIDAEIEIVDNNLVTGKTIKCQIKGKNKINWDKNYISISIKKSTWGYWKSLNLPLIVFLIDIKTEDIYWSLPFSVVSSVNSKTVNLKFFKSNNTKGQIGLLR